MANIKDQIISAFSGPNAPVGISLKAGDVFPLTELRAGDGAAPPPAQAGQRTVLWFYPKDDTPG